MPTRRKKPEDHDRLLDHLQAIMESEMPEPFIALMLAGGLCAIEARTANVNSKLKPASFRLLTFAAQIYLEETHEVSKFMQREEKARKQRKAEALKDREVKELRRMAGLK